MPGQSKVGTTVTPGDAKLISFDEAGFTGPELLNEQQPYFAYASHILTEEESDDLITRLRAGFNLAGNELKASRLKKRGTWPQIVGVLCEATQGKAKVVTFEKRLALAGKVFEYCFEPVLEANSGLFYGVDFHRYITNAIYGLMRDDASDYEGLAKQMQAFMRTFDPSHAPDLFNDTGKHPIEMERILAFCRGYADKIAKRTHHLRPEVNNDGKWTLDLTDTALNCLVVFGWGKQYRKIRLLCDESKPLAARADYFNAWIGKDQAVAVTNGKAWHEARANLAGPIEFGSSETFKSIQVADLLAGMSMDVCIRGDNAPATARDWLNRHRESDFSILHQDRYDRPGSYIVRRGREILKELAARAETKADPLAGMAAYVERLKRQFPG